MISLLLGFHFFYDDWGSMIAIFFTIASDFIAIDAALGAKPLATGFAQMNERMLDDQKFAHVLQRFDLLLAGEVKDPVDIKRKILVFFFEALAADTPYGSR